MVVGFWLCSLLFFFGGVLTGYLYCEKSFVKESAAEDKTAKTVRKPSTTSNKQLVNRIINKQIGDLRRKTKVPRIPGLTKFQQYKARLIG